MAARDPDLVETNAGLTTWLSNDATLTDVTAAATDDNLTVDFARISKNEEALKATFNAALATLAVGDTISFFELSEDVANTWALLAYTAASTVTATGKITAASVNNGFVVFTITQAFIDQLADLGSGKFAVRFVEDLQTSFPGNDNRFSEVDADLTGGARRVFVI